MKYIQDTTWWYSIIAAVLMVWFLLVLSTSTLNLVLQELQDGRGRQDYITSFAWAEWALELALLDIKKQWYGYDNDTFIEKEILGSTPRTPKISYEFNSKVDSYTGNLEPLEIDIIPLFSLSSAGLDSITNMNFSNSDGRIVWNIITQKWWISWKWDFNMLTSVWEKLIDSGWSFIFRPSEKIQDILSWEDYLILQNLHSTSPSSYTLTGNGWWFTLPRAEIISSARVWKYTQNLKTVVDNTEFLWILRYSVYSWE